MSGDKDPIPLFKINWEQTDIEAVTHSIERGGYWAKGPNISQFEKKIEEHLAVKHAIVVNSGTTALVAALNGLGIGDGDEVIVPSFTFIATANAVRLAGAEPVFADIENRTYGLSPSAVESEVTEDTAGIIAVHCYGASCKINELSMIAEEHNIPLIEDAAEVLGAEYNGQKLGTFGNAAALSFCQNKIVPTGEGGAVVTNDDKIAQKVRLYRSHGRASGDYFDSTQSGQYTALGTNIRMSDLTAALGCSQIDRIDELIEARQVAAQQLNEGFADLDGIISHKPLDEGTHVYQLYTVELADYIDRQHVIKMLDGMNIASKIYWDPPVHRTRYYIQNKKKTVDLPVTDNLSSRVLSLPMYPGLDSTEITRIVDAVTDAVESQR